MREAAVRNNTGITDRNSAFVAYHHRHRCLLDLTRARGPCSRMTTTTELHEHPRPTRGSRAVGFVGSSSPPELMSVPWESPSSPGLASYKGLEEQLTFLLSLAPGSGTGTPGPFTPFWEIRC